MNSDSDEEDWEEIDLTKPAPSIEILMPAKTVKLTKQQRIERHKASLLLLVAASLHRNRKSLGENYRACALSLSMTRSHPSCQSVLRDWTENMEISDYSNETFLRDFPSPPLTREESSLLLRALLSLLGFQTRLVCSLFPFSMSRMSEKKKLFFPIEFHLQVFRGDKWLHLDLQKGCFDDAPVLECLYVIGIDSDSTVKDLTRLYSQNFNSKVIKRTCQEFFGQTCWLLSKSGKTAVDYHEDVQMVQQVANEPMPTNLQGFRNHPLFALEKQLKSSQVIYPKEKKDIIGYFKQAPVYPRKNVQEALTRQAWKQKGRFIPPDTMPIKKKRKREETGLYAYHQTTSWPAVVLDEDEQIPVNKFGNIEVFHPDQIPSDCQLVDKSFQKAAQQLGIVSAPAVTGFSHASGRSYPVVDALVVKTKDFSLLLQTHEQLVQAQIDKDLLARQRRCLLRWKRLTIALLNKHRLERQYLK